MINNIKVDSMEDNNLELLTDVTVFKHKLWAFEYADRMEKWFNGFKQAPVRIDAELHTRCNLNCGICARRGSYYEKMNEEQRKKTEMTPKKWVQIAEDAGKMGVKAWNISGLCEPLVRPDILFPTMRMIKAYDMFGEMTTNGTLWDEKQIEETVKMGWDSICISIDSADARVHDSIRGVDGTFKKATNTLENFRKVRDRYKTDFPVLTVNVVLNKLNYLNLGEIVEMSHEFGADAIFVEPMVVFNQRCGELRMNGGEIQKFKSIVDESKEVADEHGIVLDITAISPELEIDKKSFRAKSIDMPKKKFDKSLIENSGNIREVLINEAKKHQDEILSIPCYYPWFNLIIRGNGTTIHCGEWKEREENIKNKDLEDIWFGKRFSEIRNQFLGGSLPPFCEKCRPNVIEDIRIVRKSIKEFRNTEFLRKKYLEFLNENKKLKQCIFSLKRLGYDDDIRCIRCAHKKELTKFKDSLTFKFFSLFYNTTIEKPVKKLLKNKEE